MYPSKLCSRYANIFNQTEIIFFLISLQKRMLWVLMRLVETLLMCTHNMCFFVKKQETYLDTITREMRKLLVIKDIIAYLWSKNGRKK